MTGIEETIPLAVVAGPTASGKTGLAVELALRLDGEVVSADSMQIYRRMAIATAKPTPEEQLGVPHHLIDFLEPGEQFSVAQYVELARKTIREIRSRGKLPIVAGGTGLYIQSLVDNIAFSPQPSDPALREALRQRAQREGRESLLRELASFDPESAARLHPNNLGRVIRAIEVYRLTGKTMTQQMAQSRREPSPYRPAMLGLTYSDRQLLYNRIDRRVDAMVAQGLLEEARQMREEGLSSTAAQAIGYKELEGYFAGEEPLEEALERMKRETRRYAKRQLTWFRRDERFHWLEMDRLGDGAADEAEKILVRELNL